MDRRAAPRMLRALNSPVKFGASFRGCQQEAWTATCACQPSCIFTLYIW
uniref:Uncharacterized protein n=1 Tax=Varanus komodoensis TaxID=61221 RepID=A0A8D2JG79_VARKO